MYLVRYIYFMIGSGYLKKFNERLVDIRKSKNISQKELASAIGVSPTAVNLWEKGKTEPNIKMIEKIANYLNVSYDYLLGWKKYEKNIVIEQDFENYIKSIGYMIEVKQVNKSSFVVTLFKDKVKSIFTEKEFYDFQNAINQNIEFEIFKHDHNKSSK